VGPEAPAYLHLTDGGVADNTGVRALWVALRREDGFLRRAVETGRVKKLVVIQVNAQNDPLRGLGDEEGAPAAWTVTERTARATVNNYTFESLQLLREDQEIKALLAQNKAELHLVDVSFLAVADDARRARLLGIPTELRIEPEDLAAVLAAAREVLDGSRSYRALLEGLR
jgi:NTE family protein